MKMYVGMDPREEVAGQVCKYSIVRFKGNEVEFLRTRPLRDEKLFWRTWFVDKNGQYWDLSDMRPFSTEFSHTRFLVSNVCRMSGLNNGWIGFSDCDFVFLEDPNFLVENTDPKFAIMCVKHDWSKIKEGIKMDGVIQERYKRKLWSSLFLWNLDHESNKKLTLDDVNSKSGSWLHNFSWLKDDEIGNIPEEWNFIPGFSNNSIIPKAIHYSFGGPWMEGYEDVEYSDLWLEMRENMFKTGKVF